MLHILDVANALFGDDTYLISQIVFCNYPIPLFFGKLAYYAI
jgi:hypothetical protein